MRRSRSQGRPKARGTTLRSVPPNPEGNPGPRSAGRTLGTPTRAQAVSRVRAVRSRGERVATRGRSSRVLPRLALGDHARNRRCGAAAPAGSHAPAKTRGSSGHDRSERPPEATSYDSGTPYAAPAPRPQESCSRPAPCDKIRGTKPTRFPAETLNVPGGRSFGRRRGKPCPAPRAPISGGTSSGSAEAATVAFAAFYGDHRVGGRRGRFAARPARRGPFFSVATPRIRGFTPGRSALPPGRAKRWPFG